MVLSRRKGFTLVELIVVIVILGILAVIATPKYMNYKREARVAVVNGLLAEIKSANTIFPAHLIVKGNCGETRYYFDIDHPNHPNPTIDPHTNVPFYLCQLTPSGYMWYLNGFDTANDVIANDGLSMTNPNGIYTTELWTSSLWNTTYNMGESVIYSLDPVPQPSEPLRNDIATGKQVKLCGISILQIDGTCDVGGVSHCGEVAGNIYKTNSGITENVSLYSGHKIISTWTTGC